MLHYYYNMRSVFVLVIKVTISLYVLINLMESSHVLMISKIYLLFFFLKSMFTSFPKIIHIRLDLLVSRGDGDNKKKKL